MNLQRPRPRMGLYDPPFWDYAAAGELRLQRCASCAAWRFPPGPACPHCLCQEWDWQPLCGRGTLLGWTVFQRQYFPELPVPYTVVSVQTEEGPLLVGNLLDAGAQGLRPGLPLQLCFEDAETDGQRWRIPQWRLALEEAAC